MRERYIKINDLKAFFVSLFLFFFIFSPLRAIAHDGEMGEIHGTVLINSVPAPHAVVYLSGEDARKFLTGVSEYTVIQKNLEFEPTFLVVPQGAEVAFENRDMEVHNIYTKAPENRFDTGAHMPGTVAVVTFKNPGPVPLRCNTHFDMKGMVYVAASPFFAVTDMEGNFHIENVPPGNFSVEAWHPRLTSEEAQQGAVEIELPGGHQKLDLKFTAKAKVGTDLTEVFSQDWDLVVEEIKKSLEEVIDRWKKGSRTGATTRVLTIQSRLYERSGLKNTIIQSFGHEQNQIHENRFDQIRKGVQGVTGKIVSESALRREMEHLVTALNEDVRKIQGED